MVITQRKVQAEKPQIKRLLKGKRTPSPRGRRLHDDAVDIRKIEYVLENSDFVIKVLWEFYDKLVYIFLSTI